MGTTLSLSPQAVRSKRAVLGFARHWLLVFNLALGIYVGLPWLAPVLMKLGWEGAGHTLYTIYSFLCHQLADRSFFLFGPQVMYPAGTLLPLASTDVPYTALRTFIGTADIGYKVAWSDRMVALYGGMFLGGLLFSLVRRRTFSPWWIPVLLAPMFVDGTTHFISDLAGFNLGFRYTNAWLAELTLDRLPGSFYVGNALGSFNSWARLISGTLAGLGAVWGVYSLIEDYFARVQDALEYQLRSVRPKAVSPEESARLVAARYNRIAPFYDLMETLMEHRQWRERAWTAIEGGAILEVGVGTGRNLPYHPAAAQTVGIDISTGMLAQAKRRAAELQSSTQLLEMNVETMTFPDQSFDSAVATCVFCSVPNPVAGLREIRRVVKSGGKVILLEHMRVENRFFGRLMDWLDPLICRFGPHINRRTVENVRQAGLILEQVVDLIPGGLMRLIVARVP